MSIAAESILYAYQITCLLILKGLTTVKSKEPPITHLSIPPIYYIFIHV